MYIPTYTELQKQFAQLSPDSVAIAPNIKIIDADRPNHVRVLILSNYVLLACINSIYKYGHAWVIW